MAVIATGTVHFGTTLTVGVKNVTIDQMCGEEDTSNFSDADSWKTYLATFKEWTGSMDVIWTATTNTYALGESGTLHADITNGPDYSGTAFIKSIGSPLVKDGVMVNPVTFRGTGALTSA
jgi:hypothetical protein